MANVKPASGNQNVFEWKTIFSQRQEGCEGHLPKTEDALRTLPLQKPVYAEHGSGPNPEAGFLMHAQKLR